MIKSFVLRDSDTATIMHLMLLSFLTLFYLKYEGEKQFLQTW